MPILKEEISLFPAHLLGGKEPAASFRAATSVQQWRAVCTKARHEKALARHLLAHEVPYYLPLVRKKSRFRGRTITSLLPVFSSYVFVYAADEDLATIWQSNRVVNIIEVDDGDRLRRELREIQRLIESRAPMTIESLIVSGDRVRVTGGPLEGMEGTVLTRRGETRLLVAVEFMQQGASVAIDDYLLERIA